MIAIPEILADCADKAGMKVPDNLLDFDNNEYPHWYVYLTVQLGAPLPWPSAHWENAEVIAAVPEDKIRLVTEQDLQELGLAYGFSNAYA